jgi:hypothetical protein
MVAQPLRAPVGVSCASHPNWGPMSIRPRSRTSSQRRARTMRYSAINPTTLFTDSKRVQTDVGRCNRHHEQSAVSAGGLVHRRTKMRRTSARTWGRPEHVHSIAIGDQHLFAGLASWAYDGRHFGCFPLLGHVVASHRHAAGGQCSLRF